MSLYNDKILVKDLLSSVIVTGAGSSFKKYYSKCTFQATGAVSASTGTATVVVEVSNDNINWETLSTITLTLGTTETSDGDYSDAPWKYVRGNVTALTGTDATVYLYMGFEKRD